MRTACRHLAVVLPEGMIGSPFQFRSHQVDCQGVLPWHEFGARVLGLVQPARQARVEQPPQQTVDLLIGRVADVRGADTRASPCDSPATGSAGPQTCPATYRRPSSRIRPAWLPTARATVAIPCRASVSQGSTSRARWKFSRALAHSSLTCRDQA